MKATKNIGAGYWLAIAMSLSASSVFAADSHTALAVKHAEEAVKATDGKAIIEHAEAANSHAITSMEHLNAGSKSLSEAIDHAKQNKLDLSKKAAEAAVIHLKAAQ